MIVKLLTEHHLGFLSLKEGCRGSSESSSLACEKADVRKSKTINSCQTALTHVMSTSHS